MTLNVAISIQPHMLAPTRILSSFIPVDKAGDQHNECEESDGTHQADKPALSWYSFVDAGETWRETNPCDFDISRPFHQDTWLNVYNRTKPIWCSRRCQGTTAQY